MRNIENWKFFNGVHYLKFITVVKLTAPVSLSVVLEKIAYMTSG